MSNWDKLSMREKAAYIKVGVLNGLTSISDIKEYYDRFDERNVTRINKFDDGGYTTPEELALKKIKATTKPASNYSEASDLNVSKIRENVTNYILKYFPNRSLGLTNCTLTASLFYGKPIGRASSIVNNPAKYGFYEVDEKYAVPGTMIIASDPEGVENPKYHSMVLSGFADKDHPFEYNNIPYNVVKGDILTSYSKGRNNESSWKIDIPLKTYNDLSAGKTRNRFYRPLDENGLPNVLLPEVVVTANKENNLNNAKRYVQKAVKKYDIGGPTDDNTVNKVNDSKVKKQAWVRYFRDVPKEFRNPNVDYEKEKNTKIWTDEYGRPINRADLINYDTSKRLLFVPNNVALSPQLNNSTRKTTPALDYHRLVKITENDPNGPYAATKWLLGQLAMLPISAIGAVTVPVSATVGGLVGGIGGDVLGQYASDWMFDNPDKKFNLFNSGITITPRLASRLVGGLAGGLLGGYSGYAATEKVAKPYLISREIKRMPLTGSNELPNNVGWGPKQTIAVSHKSNSPEPLVLFNPERYDVVKEGANPLGIWYLGKLGVPRTVNTGSTLEKATKAQRARKLFDDRPFTHTGDLTLEKPLVTIGEVPNRSTLSYQAEQLGADGLIYNNVYDNGYNNNLVILSFKKHDVPTDIDFKFFKLPPILGFPNILYEFMSDPTKFWNTIFKPKYDTNRLKINTTRDIPESLPGKVYIISKDSELALPKANGHSNKGNTYIYKEYMDVVDPEETIIHETAHNFRDTNPKTLKENIGNFDKDINKRNFIDDSKYTSEEIDALDNAYTFTSDFSYNNIHESYLDRLAEKSATNTLLLYAIWKQSKARNISELIAAIDKLSDDDILYMLLLTNGYGRDFIKYIASNPNTRSQAVSNIREALKYVPAVDPSLDIDNPFLTINYNRIKDDVDLFRLRLTTPGNKTGLTGEEQMELNLTKLATTKPKTAEQTSLANRWRRFVRLPQDKRTKTNFKETFSPEEEKLLWDLYSKGYLNAYAGEVESLLDITPASPFKWNVEGADPSVRLLYENPVHKGISKYPVVKSHEAHHLAYTPTEPIPDGILDPTKIKLSTYDYLTHSNATEVAARGNQFKNFLRFKNPDQKITKKDWKYLEKHYVEETGFDNNISDLFNAVDENKLDEFLKWLNKHSFTIGVLGTGTYKLSLHESNNLEEKN